MSSKQVETGNAGLPVMPALMRLEKEIKTMKTMKKPDFNKTVFVIKDGAVKESTLKELCIENADITTTPKGVCPRFHTRGNELWTWGVNGNNPARVETFDTAEEAEEALLETFLIDLNNSCLDIFDSEAEARAALEEILAE